MTDLPCPMGADHEPLRHPDAMLCYQCVHLLPQRFRRAIRRANESREGRDEVLQRCLAYFAGHRQEPPRPKPVVRYTSTAQR